MQNNYLVPNVLERTSNGERVFDLTSRLLEDRIIMIGSEVNDGMAQIVCQELLYLNNKDSKKPIHLYIMSPGGSVHAGLSIINLMNLIEAPVYTYCLGYAASMGAAILSSGEKGRRYALKDSQIMVHQVASGAEGKAHDLRVELKYTLRLNDLLLAMIAKNCGQMSEEEYNEIYDKVNDLDDDSDNSILHLSQPTRKKLDDFKKRVDRDTWLMPKAALKFGIIDEILESRQVL